MARGYVGAEAALNRRPPLGRSGLIRVILAVLAGVLLGFLLGRLTAPAPPAAPVARAIAPSAIARPTETAARLPTASPTPTPAPVPALASPPPATVAPPAATATAIPLPTATAPPTPTATRGPLRITKLGLGVYGNGGAYLSEMEVWRPSVILLLDPEPDFARSVRAAFPRAFIMGRRYVANQPLDNPAARGTAFADYVAQLAVPLKGVVNAWMSYNEVTSYQSSTANNYALWNAFQVAFANQLQGHYGVDAVAGNDAPGAVDPADYARYFRQAITVSHYFGVHAYTPPGGVSMRQGDGPAAMLRYRLVHAELARAGVPTPPFILTETGLYAGWRGTASAEAMTADLVWLTDRLDEDPYVIGQTVFGLFDFANDQWRAFDVTNSRVETLIGDYNSCQGAHPCPPGQQG